MEIKDISAAIEAILFASGDPVPTARIAQVLGVDEQQVLAGAKTLAEAYVDQGRECGSSGWRTSSSCAPLLSSRGS